MSKPSNASSTPSPHAPRRDKRLTPLVPGVRRKIERLIVRELIDKVPDFRATVQEVVEICNFPRACGDPDCARAQACARDFECYVVAHRAFGKYLPHMQAALARRQGG